MEREQKEAEEKAKQQGKSFDQWVKEKAEYDRLVKLQQNDDQSKANNQKTLKGKTFEEWQKENVARRKQESDEKKSKESKVRIYV